MKELPQHLQRYVVKQDYSRYTPIDQAVWRHIMRQLTSFLSVHAHPCYLDGLKKTGIELDRIPSIEAMSEKLELFGWRAIPVSGFIPPAAFMELQSLGVLPIASDMRTLEHLLYTPAPDIVHEAAGHAPILVDPAFAAYLKAYAQVASKAILSKDDMDQYEAIRILSDLKENPGSTAAQIKQAEEYLEQVSSRIQGTSEGALLGRMNWWTAEYGLIGDLKNPLIFGAGLLSSVGESRACLEPRVKKIPLSIECINYGYDITEQQPQLFVVKKFDDLTDVLAELAKRMAFRRGGLESLKKAQAAGTVNTVELDSGLQISGVLKDVVSVKPLRKDGNDGEIPAYLTFEGGTQLAFAGEEINGQGVEHHRHGFGSPLGRATIKTKNGVPSPLKNLSSLSESEANKFGIKSGSEVELKFESGVVVKGFVKSVQRSSKGRLIIVTLQQAKATLGDKLLFDPAWGLYDMALGESAVSVYGGPADRTKYGTIEDFTRKVVPRRVYSDQELKRFQLFDEVRKLRETKDSSPDAFTAIVRSLEINSKHDWLPVVELLEIAEDRHANTGLIADLKTRLDQLGQSSAETASHISDALRTLHPTA